MNSAKQLLHNGTFGSRCVLDADEGAAECRIR